MTTLEPTANSTRAFSSVQLPRCREKYFVVPNSPEEININTCWSKLKELVTQKITSLKKIKNIKKQKITSLKIRYNSIGSFIEIFPVVRRNISYIVIFSNYIEIRNIEEYFHLLDSRDCLTFRESFVLQPSATVSGSERH